VTLIEGFESCSLDEFPHVDHIRLTCAYLERFDADDTLQRLLTGLQKFATAKGSPGKFHYTMTRAWLEIILEARRQHPESPDAESLLAACPALADPRLLRHYYSEAALSSATARTAWVPPDLATFARAL
jgi:hypothetical protein